jgi:hypothetical protein
MQRFKLIYFYNFIDVIFSSFFTYEQHLNQPQQQQHSVFFFINIKLI